MEKSSEKKKLEWYDSGKQITNFIILTILLVIIFSQSVAITGESSLALFGSVINHNTVYLLVLVYFISLKTKWGKKYFNYLNISLIFLYFIVMITSFLTILQSISLNTIIDFALNFVLVIYLVHTMLRDTRFWKEFKLGMSPFNELTNDWYFYTIIVLSVFLLVVNLIFTVAISGIIISLLDCCFVVLFGRYIYLYRDYLDFKKKNINNSGNFDDIKETIKNTVDSTSEKVNEVIQDICDKTNDFIETNNLDDTVLDVKKKIVTASKEIKDKIEDKIDNVKDIKGELKEKKSNKKDNVSKKKGDDK